MEPICAAGKTRGENVQRRIGLETFLDLQTDRMLRIVDRRETDLHVHLRGRGTCIARNGERRERANQFTCHH